MNKDKLFEMIDEDLQSIQSELDEKITENKRIGNILSNCTYTSNIDFFEFDLIELITAYLTTHAETLSYDQIEEIIIDNIHLTTIEGYHLLEKLKGMSFTFYELFENHAFKYRDVDVMGLKTLHDEFTDINILDLFSDILFINHIREEYIKAKDEFMLECKTTKEKRMAYDFLDKEVNKEPALIELTNKYKKMIDDINIKYENENSKIKKIKIRINNYKKVKTILSNLNLEKSIITEQWIRNILDLIYSKNARREFLCQIGTYQKSKFNELYKEYNKLSEDNKLETIEIFKECDIDYNQLSKSNQEDALLMNKEKLKEFLILINKLSNEDYNVINYVLQNSNPDVLNIIILNIKAGVLTTDFVTNNLNILSVKEDTNNNYFKLIDLLEYMKNENINPRLFINDQNIYVSDSNTIKNNLKILKQYNLLSSLKTTEIFNMLKENDLASKIDMLLELGYEKELENNLGLLNSDNKKIMSLYVLKNMNLLPTDMDSLIMVLNNESFIQENDIDNYIFNVVDYRIDKSKINYTETNIYEETNSLSRTIVINDVKLSRNRVMRNKKMLENSNLQDTEKEIYSYVYGSILNEEEFDKVVSYVNGNVKVK